MNTTEKINAALIKVASAYDAQVMELLKQEPDLIDDLFVTDKAKNYYGKSHDLLRNDQHDYLPWGSGILKKPGLMRTLNLTGTGLAATLGGLGGAALGTVGGPVGVGVGAGTGALLLGAIAADRASRRRATLVRNALMQLATDK